MPRLPLSVLTLLTGIGLAAPAAAQYRSALLPPLPIGRTLRHQPRPQPAARPTSTTLRLPTQVMTYGYNLFAQAWATDPTLTRFTYNAQGLEILRAMNDSASGRGFNRTATTYNAANRVTQTLAEVNVLGTWINSLRTLFAYDARQNLTDETYQAYASGAWVTDEGYRYANTYDANGQLATQTIQSFKRNTGSYADSLRKIYGGRTAGGPWTELVLQRPAGAGQWTNWERQTGVTWYDFAQELMSSAQAQEWTNGQWETRTRLTGTYSATQHLQLVEELRNGSWKNLQRQSATYDGYGNPTDVRLEDWLLNRWSTSVAAHWNLAYNADGTVRRRVTSVDYGGGLTPTTLENFGGYQTIVLATRPTAALPAGTLQAYPNPSADGQFTVQLRNAGSTGEVRVTDALGRLVYYRRVTALPAALPLSLGARPAGLYTLELRTPAGVARQQLLVR